MTSGLAGQAFTALFARGFFRVAQLVTFLILARLLTPSEFGWFGIVSTAIALAAMLGSLGLRQSFAFQIGQANITAGEAAGTGLVLWPVMTILASAVIFVMYGSSLPGISTAMAAAIIVTSVGGLLLITLLQGINLGRGEIRVFSASETAPKVLLLLLVVLLALLSGLSLSGVLWAQSLSYVIALPAILYFALRGAGSLRPRFSELPHLLRYGLLFAVNLFLITLCARLSMFVLEFFFNADLSGQFFAAVRVNEIFLEIATALGMVLFSNAARQKPGTSIVARNARVACWMLWFFNVLAVIVFFASPLLIRVFVGSDYLEAIPALQILALSLGPTAAAKIIYPSLAGSGHPAFGTRVIVVSLTINAALAFALVPSTGLTGASWALVAGQYTLFIGYVVTLRRRFDVPIRLAIVPTRADARAVLATVMSKLRRGRGETAED